MSTRKDSYSNRVGDVSVRLFLSYSHRNSTWAKRLGPLLKVKARVATLKPWHDGELLAGDQWDREIRNELARMDIFLCLLSIDYLASQYIQEVEIPEALRRQRLGEIDIVPILLYPMDFDDCPDLKIFNHLPEFGRCWRDFEKEGGDWNDALFPIGNGIKQAIERARKRKFAATRPFIKSLEGLANSSLGHPMIPPKQSSHASQVRRRKNLE